MDHIYDNINKCNAKRNRKILNLFELIVADLNKKFQPIVKKSFIRCRKLNISPLLITQSYFPVSKYIRLKSTHHVISNKTELQQITINYSVNFVYKELMKISRKCTSKSYSCLMCGATLPINDPLRFKKNILDEL